MHIIGHGCAYLAALLLALPPGNAANPHENVRAHALSAVGASYRYGGASPDTGFDCSGLVAHVFERAWGLALPRRANELAGLGKPIRKAHELQPGDLVFYNTRSSPYSHVGIYVGDGRFVHAPRPGKRVRAESLDSPYWKARFNGARRLAPPS